MTIPYLKSYDIVGYVYEECTVLCEACGNKFGGATGDFSPIFAGDEFDHAIFCDDCGDEINVSVIEE